MPSLFSWEIFYLELKLVFPINTINTLYSSGPYGFSGGIQLKIQLEPNKTSDFPLFLPNSILALVIKGLSDTPSMNKKLECEFDDQELL